jgi:hypothetical protein
VRHKRRVLLVDRILGTQSSKRHQLMFGRPNGVAAADCAPRIVETIVSTGLNMLDVAPPSTRSPCGGFGKMAENGPSAQKVLKIAANVAIVGAAGTRWVLARPDAVKVSGAYGRALGATARPRAATSAGRSCGPEGEP